MNSRARAPVLIVLAALVLSWMDLRLSPALPPSPEPGPQAEEQSQSAEILEEFSAQDDAGSAADLLAPMTAPVTVTPGDGYATVTLSFATNRQTAPAPTHFGTTNQRDLIWGTAEVSIPHDHTAGTLETPGWLTTVLTTPNPENYVLLQSVTPQTRAGILARLQAQLAVENAVLLYVHGYNTSFEKAARRAGQLTYDLKWSGPSLFFSWPSQGEAHLYTIDQTMAARSEEAMEQVLRELAALEAEHIVVIAHSMGSQILTQALDAMVRSDPQVAQSITTVILAAPDIDVGLFHDRIVPAFAALPRTGVTLYASSQDDALRASRAVNGFARIGDTSEGLTPIEGIDMIDATGAVSDFFGHTYFGDDATILSDIYQLVREGRGPAERSTLAEITTPDGPIWQIVLSD